MSSSIQLQPVLEYGLEFILKICGRRIIKLCGRRIIKLSELSKFLCMIFNCITNALTLYEGLLAAGKTALTAVLNSVTTGSDVKFLAW